MTNMQKLKGRMVEQGVSVDMMADYLGITSRTAYGKLQAGERFTISEANKIVELLHLSSDDAVSIFFASGVA